MSAHITPGELNEDLGDFTATRRLIPISVLAVFIGVVGALAANALLQLIGFATNVFYFHRFSTELASPGQHQLGWLAVFVPVIGALIVGLMARFGSDRIRGHGIPEALEAILIRGSRVEGRVALLKPISAAVSIGSGGPFGAEGPIIMTGGAVGSLIAQVFHLTAAERKTLLVAGAAAGMSATFAAPLAATLLAVELLLFELKPRSLVPVALASATAMVARVTLLGPGPVFPAHPHAAVVGAVGGKAIAHAADVAGAAGDVVGAAADVVVSTGMAAMLGCVVLGLLCGVMSALMTSSVYLFEDLFKKLEGRVHWMWWPAIGAVVIGIGGLICPRALGVGYDVIGATLAGGTPWKAVLLLVIVKWVIWSVSLGSGTSGGVLAPLLMIGASVGALASGFLPHEAAGFWPVVAMGAILAGTMRSPLTGCVFAVELTHDFDALLPLLVAGAVAHGFTVLVLKRSILTEKVARRGYHVTREYGIDPLEVLFVRDVMEAPPADLADAEVFARSDESLRAVVERMADTGCTRMAVVDDALVVGVVTLEHMLKGRRRHIEEETRRERVLPMDAFLPHVLRPHWQRLTSLSITANRTAPPRGAAAIDDEGGG